MKKEMYLILSVLFVLTISACSFEELTGQIARNMTNSTECADDCNDAGQKQCSGNYIRTCGQYDGDSCLDWASSYCAYGCANSACKNQTNTTCTNECSYIGQKSCSGNYIKLCGNYDADSCLEWTYSTYCPNKCINGMCNNQTNPINLTNCTQDCTYLGQRKCNGNYMLVCGNYDTDSCLDWNSAYCVSGCTNGICNIPSNGTNSTNSIGGPQVAEQASPTQTSIWTKLISFFSRKGPQAKQE